MEQCVVIGAVQGKGIYFSNCVRILRFLVYKIGGSEKPSDYFDHVMNEDSSGSVKKIKCCILWLNDQFEIRIYIKFVQFSGLTAYFYTNVLKNEEKNVRTIFDYTSSIKSENFGLYNTFMI